MTVPITTKDLEAQGFSVEGDTVRRRAHAAGLIALADRARKRDRSPLSPLMVAALVAARPAPTKLLASAPRAVLAADPSVDHCGLAALTLSTGRALLTTRLVKSNPRWTKGQKLDHLGKAVVDFAEEHAARSGTIAVVEGAEINPGRKVKPQSIVTYGVAVGTAFGAFGAALRCMEGKAQPLTSRVILVSTSWMPTVLVGRIPGGSLKQDRHAVARALFARAGVRWPEWDEPEKYLDEQDACALVAAHLCEGGWL